MAANSGKAMAEWVRKFGSDPSSKVGEFARLGADAQVADLNAKTFSESRRTNDGSAK